MDEGTSKVCELRNYFDDKNHIEKLVTRFEYQISDVFATFQIY